jgi:carnosine N-methyltransferase
MSSNPNSNNAQKDKEEDNIETLKEKSDIQKSEDSINKENSNNEIIDNKNDLPQKKENKNNENNNKIEQEKESNINEIMTKMINKDQDWEMHPTEGPIGMSSAEKDPEEYRHLRNVVSAFFNYQIDSLRDLARTERDFKSIDEKYLKRMSFNYTERLDKLKKAIWQNYSFLLKVADPYKNMFKLYKGKNGEILMEPLLVEVKDIIKMRSTLRLFTRDWAMDGIEERNSTYKPILNELKNFFEKKTKKEFQDGINILVPGAGLGRLMYEIAKLGFKSQGNEFSYYMLLCSNFIFNNTTKKDEFVLQPFIHSFSNIFNEETPFKKILIPDENLGEELSKTDTGEMSMVAGEFCHVYKDKINFFDGIATCYFIDTANNIIEYIETIHNIVKIGGLWVNIGPLLYHYTENENEISIELSWEEVKHIIIGYGFEFKKIETVKTTYSTNKDSMTQRIYNCIFFSAVKIK